MARYIGKYISKCVPNRKPEHRGVRFVRYSRGFRICSSQFAWNTSRAWLWRRKVSLLADYLGIATMEEFTQMLGPRWAFDYAVPIQSIKLDSWPNALYAVAEGFLTMFDLREISINYFGGGDAVAGMGEISHIVMEDTNDSKPEPWLSVEAVAELITINRHARKRR